MTIEVWLPTILREYTDGAKTVEGDGGTIREVLDDLDARFGGLKSRIVTSDGSTHKYLNVYVNDNDIRHLDGLETAVGHPDMISIVPAVAGG